MMDWEGEHEHRKRQLSGTVTPQGYSIRNGNGEELYTAGNSPYESQASAPIEEALPISTLKRYCEETGRDMAIEMGGAFLEGKWHGVTWHGATIEEG